MSPRRATLVALGLGLAGCNSTGVGNPAPASLQLSITRDDDTLAPVGGAAGFGVAGGPTGEAGETVAEVGGAPAGGMPATDGGVSATDGGAPATDGGAPATDGRATIQDAILVIGEVRFLPCEAGDADSLAPGPFLVDLVHGGTSPSIPAVPVPAGGFCGLDAPLAPAEAPSRLVGRSVYFGGTRADGTPFRFYANVQATLRVRARAGLTWGPGAKPSRTVFWALRPRQWLEPSELDALESTKLGDGSGAEAIDVARHPALLRAIRARLAGRSALYDDVNDDATFDSADRDAVLGDGISDAD